MMKTNKVFSMFFNEEQQAPQSWERVKQYLAGHDLALDLDAGIRQFSSGAANMNYLIHINGQKAVMRCPPKGSSPGANDVAREYKVLSGLASQYSYAPNAIHLCEDSSITGVPFCISEFREGTPITTVLPESLAEQPNIGRKLGELSLSALAELHRVDVDVAGLSALGKKDGFLERQVEGWGKRAKRVLPPDDLERAERVVNMLRASLPTFRPNSLVHNDFKLDNMLIDPERLTLNAVLDWDMCTLGDPLFDLMVTILYWGSTDDSELFKHLARMPYEADGWMSRSEAIDYYLALSDYPRDTEALVFYWTLALFRFAIIIAQLIAIYEADAMETVHVNKNNLLEVKERVSLILNELVAPSVDNHTILFSR